MGPSAFGLVSKPMLGFCLRIIFLSIEVFSATFRILSHAVLMYNIDMPVNSFNDDHFVLVFEANFIS